MIGGDLLRWRRERLPLTVYVPLAGALAAAATGRVEPVSLARATATAFVLVAGLRLADDLADADGDRVRCPQRVLPRADRRPFRVAVGGLLALGGGAVAAGPGAGLLVLVALLIGLGAWYTGLRRAVGPVAGYHVLLLKYPALVVAIAGDPAAGGRRLAAAAGLVYCALLVHEVAHDGRLRARATARAAALAAALAGLLLGGVLLRA